MTELEKRLRELVYEHFEVELPERTVERFHIDGFKAALLSAARIGAEIEREECAAVVDRLIESGPKKPGQHPAWLAICAAGYIRARGGLKDRGAK